MDQPDETEPTPTGAPSADDAESVGDALRAAVEKTLAATADSATETRQRAQDLLDDVVRRGQVAREQVTRRGEEATARVAEAIGDLRTAEGEDVEELRSRIALLEARLVAVETRIGPQPNLKVEDETSTVNPA